MNTVLVVVAGIAGLVVGSFLTVVVHRVPAGLSIVAPRSRCPGCLATIRPIDNVPVLSYLAMRGRCRSCREPISIRYPLTEIATALCFSAVAARLETPWAVPAYCVLAGSLVALTFIDLEHLRLPTPVIVTTLAVGVPLLVLASVATHRIAALGAAAASGAICMVAFAVLYVASRRGIGLGDVRLAAMCGVFLGWLGYRVAAVGMLLSFAVAGVAGVVLLTTGRAGRKSRIPFGPFLAAGTLTAVCYGPTMARIWLG